MVSSAPDPSLACANFFDLHRAERILAYDPAISEARNNWRQSAYWAANSHFVGWSAATTHFLEISALYPKFSEGVVRLALSRPSLLDADCVAPFISCSETSLVCRRCSTGQAIAWWSERGG